MLCLVRIGATGHWRPCLLRAGRTMNIAGEVIPVCALHRVSTRRLSVYHAGPPLLEALVVQMAKEA